MLRLLLVHVPALLVWTAVAFKLPALRRNPASLELRAFWLALLALAAALTVLLPGMYRAVDAVTGVPHLTRLLGNGLALCSGLAVQAFLLLLNYGDAAISRIKRRALLLLLALLLMGVLFTLAAIEGGDVDFVYAQADTAWVVEYRLVYLGYLARALTDVVRLTSRYARVSRSDALNLGLRLTAAGGLCGLGYVANEVAHMVSIRTRLGYPFQDPELVTQTLLAGSTVLIVVGSTLPAWGSGLRLERVRNWVRRYVAHRRLHPLWWALWQATPEIALASPPPRIVETFRVRDLDFRLYRRVIEIQDGWLALRPYLQPHILDAAREVAQDNHVPREDLPLLVEAASLTAALRAKAQGLVGTAETESLYETPGDDVASTVRWLVGVAYYYGESELMAAVLLGSERASASLSCSPD